MSRPQFREQLTKCQIKTNSLVCVGLDPLVDKIPHCLERFLWNIASAVAKWMMRIVDATAPFASVYKLQHAHWEAIPGGVDALVRVIAYIHGRYPHVLVFTDCKRGDIGRTQERYRIAHFDMEGADGMNVNQYMGESTVRSLVDEKHRERAIVGLGRTSNPEAWRIQDAELKDGRKVWELFVEEFMYYAKRCGVLDNAGIVMGAAYRDLDNPAIIHAEHLVRATEITGNKLWKLIPGMGTQGGCVKETVQAAYQGPGTIVPASSSDVIFASREDNYTQASGGKAETLRDLINQYR